MSMRDIEEMVTALEGLPTGEDHHIMDLKDVFKLNGQGNYDDFEQDKNMPS